MKKIYKLFVLAILICCGTTVWAAQTLPYSYGFEDYELSTDGWTKYFGTSLSKNNAECAIVGDAKKTGSYGFRFSSYQTSGANAQYLISPELDAAAGLDLTFWYKASKSSGTEKFKVGYSTTDADVASFTWGEENATNSTSWLKFEGSFPAGTKYVAIYYYSNYQYYLHVDDFEFVGKASGPALQVLDGLTKIASGYNYNFGLATAGTLKMFTMNNPGTEAAPITVTHTGNFTVTPSTVSIPAGEGTVLAIYMPETTGSDVITISSTAESIDDFVINVSGTIRDASKFFEPLLGGALPEEWTSTGTWSWSTTNGASNTTYYESGNYRLITPQLTVAEGEQFFVEVQGKYNGYQGFKFEYSANGETWTSSATVPTITSDWQTLSFNDVPAGKYYIALHGWQVNIRNFYGGTIPATPKNITLDSKTANSLTLSWTAAGSETAWKLQHSTDGESWSAEVAAGTNPFELTGLSANTLYYVRVRADIASSEWSKVASFRTACGTIDALPYAENFEGHDLNAAPLCWELLNATSTSISTRPYVAIYAQSGYYKDAKALFFRTDNSKVSYAIFPEFSFSLAKAEIAFSHKEESATGTLVLGYLTNIADASTFVALYNCTSSSSWTDEEGISLATVPEGARLAFQHTVASSYYDAAVDNITISSAPSCVKPTGLTISEESAHGAKVAWTSEATAWDLEYKLSSASEWTAAASVTNPFTLTGLNANAAYDVRVRNNCGDAQSDWIESSFNTLCEAKTLPFTEDFASGLPECWSAASQWSFYNYSPFAMRFNASAAGDLILPAITINDAAQFSFKHQSTYVSCSVILNDGEDHDLGTFAKTGENYKTETIDLSDYTGKTVTITIRGNYYQSGRYLYIDDVAVTYKPVATPTNLAAAQGNAKATITWESEETTTWNLRYRAVGAEDWKTIEGLTEKTKLLEGLTNGTEYEAQVQAVCSANRQSEWTASVTFTPEDCPNVTAVTFGAKTYNSLVVNWTTSAATNCDVRYKAGEGDWTLVENIAETTTTLTGLTTGATYTIQVKAHCGDAESWFAAAETFTPIYTEPVVAEAENITDESATVAWLAVSDAAGYEVALALRGAAASEWKATTKTDTTFSQLAANTEYDVFVRAKYANDGVSTADSIGFATIIVAPKNLTQLALGATSATYSWEKDGANTSFEYSLDGQNWNAVAAKQVELTGLTSNTAYTLYVRSVYSETLKSDSIFASFRTECEVYTLPFAQDFEGLTALPDCWGNEGQWNPWNAANGYAYFNGGYTTDNVLYTPAIQLGAADYLLKIHYKKGTKAGQFDVIIAENGAAERDTIFQEIEAAADWALLEAELPAKYANKEIIVRFAAKATGKSDADIQINDITIEALPSCRKPSIIYAINTFDGAHFEWAASHGETQFQYKVDDAEEWMLTDQTSADLNGFASGSNHTFYLRAYCGTEDQSEAISAEFTPFCPAPTAIEASNITAESAQISWTNAPGITAYQYSLNGTDWKDAESNPFTLNSLNANTQYTVSIRSKYNTAVSEAASTTFRTECAVIAALPWTENFESFETGVAPACWEVINANGDGQTTIIVANKMGFDNLDSKKLVFNGKNTYEYAYIKFPEITASLANQQITFTVAFESTTNSGNADFGYFAGEEFKLLKSFAPADEITPVALDGVNGRLAFRYKSNSAYEYALAIDNIEIVEKPSCAIPTALTASKVTDATAILTWNGEADKYRVEYSKNADFSDSLTVEATTATATLTALEAQTTYYVHVIAVCAANTESEASEAISFTTECAAVAMPFIENFDEITTLDACWKTTGTWAINDEKVLRYNARTSINGVLVLPTININAEDAVLIFRYSNIYSTKTITSSVTISAEGIDPVVIELDAVSALTKKMVDLSAFNGKAATIRFDAAAQGSSTQAYFILDDIRVIPMPCETPTNLVANAGNAEATLTWNAGEDETQWQVRYKATNAAEWIEVKELDAPTYTINGLTNGIEYEAQVSAYCDATHSSEWTESVTFTPSKPTGMEDINAGKNVIKRIENGVLYIEFNGVKYNAQGQLVK